MNSRKIRVLLFAPMVFGGALLLYSQNQNPSSVRPIGTAVHIKAPLGLPAVPIPADNPLTEEAIALGRRLYYDPMLSVDNTVACANCHDPKFGFADGKSVSDGVQGKKGTRNSPTVFNSTYYDLQFWDGRSPSLEKQAEGPVQNPVEMAHTLKGVEDKLNAYASYREQFERAFGPGPVQFEMVEKALASFERTVVSGDSPFDRWKYGKDEHAVSTSVKRGFVVFTSPKKGNCAACHLVGEGYALFTDNKFHNIGVGADGMTDTLADEGRFAVTHDAADHGAFRTPSLRNIALTGPYMHDGSLKALKDVMDFYIGGGNSNSHLDKNIHVLDSLSGQERADIVAFMESLTGTIPANVGPPAPLHEERTGARLQKGN